MMSFPPCKINLGLNILSKRSDGYHNIETCFYPVPWTDVLEIIEAKTLSFTSTGLSIPGKAGENLCLNAYHRLWQSYEIPPVAIHLHKSIPTGAGLGGGSSDAAHTIRQLNLLFKLGLSLSQEINHAVQIGSDCAFFIQDKPMIGTGRGEILAPVSINLKGKYLVIVNPGINISTADAYRGVKPQPTHGSLSKLLSAPLSMWRGALINDFEAHVFREFPAIGEIKEKLYRDGALFASMSGSGSSVFGIFDQPVDARSHFRDMIWWSGEL
jgi:4-diphosphocytidyl-2-C-methyl-D-erythritol kinase